jgi:site-specific DNA-methyltransferase (adenine-specific)
MISTDPADPHPQFGPPEWIELHDGARLDLAAPWNLALGDALRVLMALPTGCADAVVTDPPYSSGGFTRGDRMGSTTNKYVQTATQIERPDFAGDNRDQRGYLVWCSVWMEEALRVVKPGGSILTFTDWRQLPVTTDAVQSGGWVWRGIVPWDKGEGTRPRRGGFRAQAEYVVWGTAGHLREDHEEYLPGFLHVADGQYATGSLVVPIRQADKHHITGKPTDLMRELVRIAPRGGLIVDPFAGSGTTGVAAVEQGRRFLGVEKTAEYAEISRARLAEAEAVPTLFELPTITEAARPPALFELDEEDPVTP